MNIGEASRRSGLSTKTIRYYEEIGLLRPERSANGYRRYDDRDVHVLKFLQRSRSLGFSLDEVRRLLSLYENDHRRSTEVRQLADRRLAEIDRKIDELKSLKKALEEVAQRCRGDENPDCPILDEIGKTGGAVERTGT